MRLVADIGTDINNRHLAIEIPAQNLSRQWPLAAQIDLEGMKLTLGDAKVQKSHPGFMSHLE